MLNLNLNVNANAKCKFYLRATVCGLISHMIKHWHSNRLLHVAIHVVIVVLHIHTNGHTHVLLPCFQFVVAFTFIVCIRIMHRSKWNLESRSG